MFEEDSLSAEIVRGEKKREEEEIKKMLGKAIMLEDVYEVYRKWLHIEDTKRIDVGLAVALSVKMQGTPLWLIFIGPSGDWKTEQLLALRNDDKTYILDTITSKTLISGSKKVQDLAPELNGKMLIIYDMAQMLKLPPIEKASVWAQLRSLYDGSISKTFGSGKRMKYDNLRVTLLAGSTPHIDSQILIYQDLGTRELLYRTEENVNEDLLLKKVLFNEDEEEKMKRSLQGITFHFLKDKEIRKRVLEEEEIKRLAELVNYLKYMRASADVDSYSGEVISDVSIERPTRCMKQLKRMYVALRSLSEDYPAEKAFGVIKHIVLSSSNQNRCKVYHFIRNMKGRHTTSAVSNNVKLGKKTAYKELNILWNMGLICHETEELDFGRIKDWWYYDESVNRYLVDLTPLIPNNYTSLNIIDRGIGGDNSIYNISGDGQDNLNELSNEVPQEEGLKVEKEKIDELREKPFQGIDERPYE